MKRASFFILAAALFLTAITLEAHATTFAADGSAIVPGVRTRYTQSTKFYSTAIQVTNTTSCNVECKATFYDQDGNNVTSTFLRVTKTDGTSSDSSTTITDVDGQFTLPARSTYNLVFSISSPHRVDGFATIEWRCDSDTIQKALSATSRTFFTIDGNVNMSQVPVNGGELF